MKLLWFDVFSISKTLSSDYLGTYLYTQLDITIYIISFYAILLKCSSKSCFNILQIFAGMIEEKRAEVEKAIADHAAIKKDAREDIHDEEETREEEEEEDEEEEGEVRDENSEAPVERMDIEEAVEKDNLNGVSDKENDAEEESMVDNEQKIESSPNPGTEVDVDIEETT